jgi:hypothetical protein
MALTMKEKAVARTDRVAWPPSVTHEFQQRQFNGCVGTKLLSEDDRVRVWEIRLRPGERIGFHRHVLDYFWTAVTPGRARSHQEDGSTVESEYEAGETRHESYGRGEYKIHDLQNTCGHEIVFTTVEFLQSANKPLEVPRPFATAAE